MGLEYFSSTCKNDLGSECDWLDGAKIGNVGFNNPIVVQVEKNIKSDKILIPIDCIVSGKSVKVIIFFSFKILPIRTIPKETGG